MASVLGVGPLRLPAERQLRPYRFAARAPSPQPLRGSLESEGFGFQYAARALALVMLLVAARLSPRVGYRNRVVATEVIALPLDSRDQKMECGSIDEWYPEPSSGPEPPGFNAVLDSVIRMLEFRKVVNSPGCEDPALQLFLGGMAPSGDEVHFAFASDCFLWAAVDA